MIRNDHLQPRLSPIAPGEHAPAFTLPDQDRNEWRLADAVRRGDVVLCFFPMAFTSVCSVEMKCITEEMNQWAGKGATVVGLSTDSFAVLKAFADKEGYRQPLLADMHRQVCKAYGLFWPDLNVANRGTVVIARDASGQGVVRFAQARAPGAAMNWHEIAAQF